MLGTTRISISPGSWRGPYAGQLLCPAWRRSDRRSDRSRATRHAAPPYKFDGDSRFPLFEPRKIGVSVDLASTRRPRGFL